MTAAADRYPCLGTWQGANGDIRHDDRMGQMLEIARLFVNALVDGISLTDALKAFSHVEPFVDLLADPGPAKPKHLVAAE